VGFEGAMAKPGRKRRVDAERYPGGDIKPTHEISPIIAKRLMMAAAAKMTDSEWGTVVGRYFLTGQISSAQYEAAKKFGALSESYDKMMQGPKPPAQVTGERIISAQIDPFSEAGEAEVERHKTVADSLDKLRGVIGSRSIFEDMRRMCAGLGELPENYARFLQVKAALGSLVIFWKIDSRQKPR
jgi:hypothetical protein